MTNELPTMLQDRYEVRDGFIIKKGETDPAIFAAMESIKADTVSYTHLTLPTILRV